MRAERGRRACAVGGAGPPSYTTGLRTPAASTAPPRHTAALTTLTVADALEPPPGQDGRVRRREVLCCEQRQRWLSPDPRAHDRSIADAVPSTTRGAALHDHAVREVPEGSPHGAGDRSPTTPRWSTRDRGPPTAKRSATSLPQATHLLPSALQRTARFTATGRAT